MKDLLFSYCLSGSWGERFYSLEIFDRKKDNIICKEENKKEVVTLDYDLIEKIKVIISKNDNLKKIDFPETPPILDGTHSTFELNFNGRIYSINSYNLWWFSWKKNIEEYKNYHNNNPDKAINLLNFHKEISDLLAENGVDKRYLSLDN